MRIAVVSLSSCLGCQQILLNLGEEFYQIIGGNEFVYFPFLEDKKTPSQCDLAIIEGGVRDERQLETARALREVAGKVMALGSCAVYGGVPGLANLVSEPGLFRRSYEDFYFEDLPQGLGRLLPLDAHVQVDIKVPGCPPPQKMLGKILLGLSRGETLREDMMYAVERTVCSECKVSCNLRPEKVPRRLAEGAPAMGECLLEQGYICLGPVTLGGCKARCPAMWGYPCTGCRGPSLQVIIENLHDIKIDTLRRLARAGKVTRKELEAHLPDIPHTFYKFCFAEPLMREKRQGGTAEFLRVLGEGIVL